MGGCNPWWNGGYYQPNIGIAYGGYIPPLRPHFPIHGRGGGGGRNGPRPLIAVNRLPNHGVGQAIVAQRNTPLVIGGQRVLPLRPIPMGEQAHRSESGFLNSPRPTYSQRDPSQSGNLLRQGYGQGLPGNPGPRPGYTSQQGNPRSANGNGFNGASGSSGAGHWTAPAGSHAYTGGGSSGGGSHSSGASGGGGGSHSGGGSVSSGGGSSSGGGGSHGGGGGGSAPSGGGSHK